MFWVLTVSRHNILILMVISILMDTLGENRRILMLCKQHVLRDEYDAFYPIHMVAQRAQTLLVIS